MKVFSVEHAGPAAGRGGGGGGAKSFLFSSKTSCGISTGTG